jgi:TatD DNase family protein
VTADPPGGVPAEWTEPADWKSVALPPPLPAPILDAHTHLDAVGCRTAVQVEAELDLAEAVGVAGVVTVADDMAAARWAAAAAAEHDRVWAAVGLHPTRADALNDAAKAELTALAAGPRVVAIGETGLDYYWDAAPRETQQAAFRWHIGLAKQLGKTLMIHDRLAHDDVLAVLDDETPPETVVFHCFSGDLDIARRCLDRGYLLSFAGPVTFRKATDLHEVVAFTPEDRILVETDAPFLAPHPQRGRKNHPYACAFTLRFIAELRKTDLGSLANRVMTTTKSVYRIR